jgi:protein TorT
LTGWTVAGVLVASLVSAVPLRAEVWHLEARTVPFDDASLAVPVDYAPLARAARGRRLCVLYPHLKDA